MNKKLLAFTIMGVTFFNFFAGLSGLIAVLISVVLAHAMGFDKLRLKSGLYSFNSLLTGIGMGTFFDPGYVFFSLLLMASLISLILSVTMGGWLFKYGLPFLSIPFVLAFWFILLPAPQFENLGLTQRNIYWMNEIYSIGGSSMLNFFQTINTLPLNKMVDIYLRSMSSIFFQDNLIAGIVIAVALLFCSRIAFSLSIIGFISAYLFARFSGSAAASITYYNIGANYIMVAIAIGGFFTIPSKHSYLWTILLVPMTSLLLLFMSKIVGVFQLPIFSLPFSIVVMLFIYFLILRTKPSGIIITPIQLYSPEKNLYSYQNNSERLSNLLYYPLHLPFRGEWTVSQGHNGKYTHKGEWGQAFDFMILDDHSKTHTSEGLACEDYYCYNKPVVSPADGFVEVITDYIDDNEIGQVNTTENWGNSIVIRHLPGLYTQLSHLKKGTFKVAKGDFVRQGELLAYSGNSGRSPVPHLHFQVQANPLTGSGTIDYPFAYYYQKENSSKELQQFSKPAEGASVSGITTNALLKNAFDISPGTKFAYSYTDEKGEQLAVYWETFTDAYNGKYLYCKETASVAYYVNDGTMFYFTAFYGNKRSLLYFFYLSLYRVFLGEFSNTNTTDRMPLNISRTKKTKNWFHDFISPFHNFIHLSYSIVEVTDPNITQLDRMQLKSMVQLSLMGKTYSESESTITIGKNSIREFTYKNNKTKIQAKWLNTLL